MVLLQDFCFSQFAQGGVALSAGDPLRAEEEERSGPLDSGLQNQQLCSQEAVEWKEGITLLGLGDRQP